MTPLAKDTVLGSRYALRSRIAVGGMGEVWRAEDTLLRRPVAVKVLKTELSGDPSFVDRFRAEATTTASLSHPGIAEIYDYGEARVLDELPVAYLVMELVRGEPLSAILAAEGRLTVVRTLDIVGQVANALQAAHVSGMVHRDIKPGNVMVAPDGRVKVTDFGIALLAYSVPLTEHGMVVGTAQYFSPEQAEGHVVGTASDVYSVGVVAYECLAGRLPFRADNPLTVALMQIRDQAPPLPPDVTPAARALVGRCLAKVPAARYLTGAELARAVRSALSEPYVVSPAIAPAAVGWAAQPDGAGRPHLPAGAGGPSQAAPGFGWAQSHPMPGNRVVAGQSERSRRGVLITMVVLAVLAVLVVVIVLALRSGAAAVNGTR